MKQIWLKPKNLIGKYDLPSTVQGITKKARNEEWQCRKVIGQKGGGYEYEVSSIIDKYNHLQQYDANANSIAPINKGFVEQNNQITIKFDSERYTLVPEFDIKVAAGNGAYPLNEDKIGQFIFSRYWLSKEGLSNANLAIFHVIGDSMETTINDGDIILVNVKEEGWTGALDGVFIILFNDMLLVKRLQYDMINNGFHIISDNPSYKPYFIKIEENMSFKIMAKVERILTKMRPTKVI